VISLIGKLCLYVAGSIRNTCVTILIEKLRLRVSPDCTRRTGADPTAAAVAEKPPSCIVSTTCIQAPFFSASRTDSRPRISKAQKNTFDSAQLISTENLISFV
jgi:hypothetical protein